EALARWTHPALGPITPDEFIPLAEASGLMGQLTTTVLRQALVACKGWQRRAPGAGVSVNVSADTVLDHAFVRHVADILDEAGSGRRPLAARPPAARVRLTLRARPAQSSRGWD